MEFAVHPLSRCHPRDKPTAEARALAEKALVGRSFGAGPTVETVLRYPAEVGGLVLIAGALGVSDPAPAKPLPAVVRWLLDTGTVRNALVATFATNPQTTRSLLSTTIHRKEAADNRRADILRRPLWLRDTTPDLGHWLRYFTGPDPAAWSLDRARYRDIAVKTALIWDDRDMLTPLGQGQDIQRLIAGSTSTVLPGIGHIPQVEDPSGLAPVLSGVLRSLAQK